jgi:septal ring factor EnvC (AmiA/AmiB activator)
MAIDKLSRELATVQMARDGVCEEKRSLEARVEDQKGKLEESHQLLQSNQQMIQWLNQQVSQRTIS